MKAISYLIFITLLQQTVLAQTFDEILAKGDTYYESANYEEAIKYFTQAIEKDKKNVKGYWYRADAYRQNNQYKEAAADYSKALELDPGNIKFFTRRGDCYFNINEYALALSDYAKGIELDAANATLWLYRGDCYAKLNDSEKACSDYQKAFELGDKSAKSQAKALACEWVTKLRPLPCPTGEAPISKVEVDAFTGAVVISKGLYYDDFKIITEKNEYTVTGPEWTLGESLIFKITYPKNFCVNEDDEAEVGTGFWLYDETGKELGGTNNIYEGGQSIQQDYLKSLSVTLTFEAPLEANKNYTIKVRYFDAAGNGEVLVTLPFKLGQTMNSSSETFSTQSVLDADVITSSVDIEPKLLEVKPKGKNILVKPTALFRNGVYSFTITAKENLPLKLNAVMRLVGQDGKSVLERTIPATVQQNKVKMEWPTQGIKPGTYKLWIRFSDAESLKNLAIVTPVVIK